MNCVCFIIFVAVNECKIDNGGCAHMCNDSLFAYSCHCHEGFTLHSDNHNCIGKTFIWTEEILVSRFPATLQMLMNALQNIGDVNKSVQTLKDHTRATAEKAML